MKRNGARESVAACFCLGVATPSFAAPPARPVPTCLGDVRGFMRRMREGGHQLGGSDYGYGDPFGGFGHGAGDMMGDDPAEGEAQNGHRQPCEDVLSATRDSCQRYVANMTKAGAARADDPSWRQKQIDKAQPVTGEAAMSAAPEVTDGQFTIAGQFDGRSAKADAYRQATLGSAASE